MSPLSSPTAATPGREGRAPSRALAWLVAVVVLVVGLGATVLGSQAARRATDDEDAARLARIARDRAGRIADAVRDDVAVLQAAAAFQAANDTDMAAFASYTARLPLADNPGLGFISYIKPVAPSAVPALEEARRAAGQPDFFVHPGPMDDRYHVILFSGPNPGSTDGLDVGQVDILPAALETAAASGAPVVTDPFVRIQDRDHPAAQQFLSVAFYVPVYAAGAQTGTAAQRLAALLGWTATAVPVRSLVYELGLTGTDEVRLAVRDVDQPAEDIAVVPDEAEAEAEADAASATSRFDVLGQQWEVEITALPTFDGAAGSQTSVAVTGSVASVAVAALVLTLALRRRRLSLAVQESRSQAAATEGRFRAIVDNAPVGVVVIDIHGKVLDFNPTMATMLGDPTARALEIVRAALPEDDEPWVADFDQFGSGQVEHLVAERRLQRADGSSFWARTTSAPLRGEQAFVVLVQDVTSERLAAEAAEELRSRRARFEALVRHSTDLIIVIGPDRRTLYASPAVAALVGVSPDDAIGIDVLRAVHRDDRLAVIATLDLAMAAPGVHGPVRYRLVSAAGEVRWVDATATNLLDDPDVGGIVANCRDVTAQEEAAEALRQRAYHDPLTGLATRDVLLDRLTGALAAAREATATVALLFVDLDRFKQVNDRFGHAAGDALLVEVGNLVADAVRPGDMVARHGGDEFVVLLSSVRGLREARAVAERVRTVLRRPVVVGDGVVVEPGASVGVALSDGSSTAEALLRDADAALYRAKRSGRDRVEVFDDELRRRAVRRLDTELVLRQALEDDSLALRFEPVIDLDDGTIVGAEARVRLVLPSGEVVSYAELLPVAQEAGLASELASQALEAACQAVKSWSGAVDGPQWVGLDVSAGEVTHPTFIERLSDVLVATAVDASALRLELPVDVVSQGSSLTRRAIAAAQALGVRVVLDGVGAELRSLAALGGFGVDGVKLDLAALPNPVGDPVAAAVAASVGEVAAAAGLPVVVVGADEPAQLEVVRALGFHYVQGAAVAPIADAGDLIVRSA